MSYYAELTKEKEKLKRRTLSNLGKCHICIGSMMEKAGRKLVVEIWDRLWFLISSRIDNFLLLSFWVEDSLVPSTLGPMLVRFSNTVRFNIKINE